MTREEIEKLPVIELIVDTLDGNVFDVREADATSDRIAMLADRYRDGQPVDPILVALDRTTVIDGRTRVLAAKQAKMVRIKGRISTAPNMVEKIFEAISGNSQTALPPTAGDMAKVIADLRRLGVSRAECQKRLSPLYAKGRIRQLLQEDAREDVRRKINQAIVLFKANRCDPDKTAVAMGVTPEWVMKHCTKQTQGKKTVVADSEIIQEKSNISGAHKREYRRIRNLFIRLNEAYKANEPSADIMEVADYQIERLDQLMTLATGCHEKLQKRLDIIPKK